VKGMRFLGKPCMKGKDHLFIDSEYDKIVACILKGGKRCKSSPLQRLFV
jgi:hypothetical protein